MISPHGQQKFLSADIGVPVIEHLVNILHREARRRLRVYVTRQIDVGPFFDEHLAVITRRNLLLELSKLEGFLRVRLVDGVGVDMHQMPSRVPQRSQRNSASDSGSKTSLSSVPKSPRESAPPIHVRCLSIERSVVHG